MLARALAFALMCVALVPVLGAACDGDKIKVTLVVILASDEGDKVDPRLKAIASEVRQRNPGLKSFRIKEMASLSLDPEEKSAFKLFDSRVVHVTVKSGADKENRVVLAVKAPDQGEIVYRTVCGKFLPIVTRCQTKPAEHKKLRERLILAIRVEPCLGD